MRQGILYQNEQGYPPDVAVAKALQQFQSATHTQHLEAREVWFNPAEVPEADNLHGLKVMSDERVAAGRVRVTTTSSDQGPLGELSREMAAFAAQVEEKAQLLKC